MKKKKVILILIFVAMAMVSLKVFLIDRHNNNHNEKQGKVYEALVMAKDQTNTNPTEDARSSLKAGDVLGIFPEGHVWSETEKQSYLLLKLTLSDSEVQELTQPQPKVSGSPTSDQSLGPQNQTVRARAYRLKIETLQFDPNTIWKAQPFPDKVFDDNLIEKKQSI